MTAKRSTVKEQIESKLGEISLVMDDLQNLRADLSDQIDNTPENFQSSETFEAKSELLDELNTFLGSWENLSANL